MPPPVRILHLSDVHFRTGTPWDSDPVLRSLVQFIGNEVRKGLAPDLVVITGDLTFAGKAAEYQLTRDWIELHLGPKRVRVLFRVWNKGAWQGERVTFRA